MRETSRVKKLQGKHVLYMLMGFFGVMFIVNGIFVYFALSSFSGLSVRDAYKRGINYNAVIASEENQSSRGWIADMMFQDLGAAHGTFVLNVQDAKGFSLSNVVAKLTVRRPLGHIQERTQIMELTTTGFSADIGFETSGQWDLIVELSGGGFTQPYHLEKRIWVK